MWCTLKLELATATLPKSHSYLLDGGNSGSCALKSGIVPVCNRPKASQAFRRGAVACWLKTRAGLPFAKCTSSAETDQYLVCFRSGRFQVSATAVIVVTVTLFVPQHRSRCDRQLSMASPPAAAPAGMCMQKLCPSSKCKLTFRRAEVN